MVLLLTVLIALISFLLILVVLVQNPKGGGLNASFGGGQAANQIMGAANSTNLLEKITWALAGSLLALCLITGVFFKGGQTGGNGIDVDPSGVITTPTAPTGGGTTAPLPGGGTDPNG
ncbi:MAG: preprotein translocase subunit SecG [Aureispira sp.]|nr:preprotein translocase subunit SecG [Aureispira sp.]